MSFYVTDDPVRDAERYYGEQDEALEKLPKCSICGEAIQDDFLYEINDELVCEECLEREFKRRIEEYVE